MCGIVVHMFTENPWILFAVVLLIIFGFETGVILIDWALDFVKARRALKGNRLKKIYQELVDEDRLE